MKIPSLACCLAVILLSSPAVWAAGQTHECVLLTALDGSVSYVSDATECGVKTSPQSTFKLPHALIALQSGVVSDPLATVPWDGSKQDFKVWEQAHSLDSAIKWSVYWFFQRTAAQIGRERMLAGLQQLGYAGDSYEGDQTSFWRNGDLEVSPYEQREFLLRLVRDDLPVEKKHIDMVKSAFLMPAGKITMGLGEVEFPLRWPDLKQVHAKSGNGRVNGEAVSWLVGYFDAGATTYVFVSRVRQQDKQELTAGTELAWHSLNELAPTAVAQCPSCADWNRPHAPFRIYGNTWFVGTEGLSAILITSDQGHVLIDGGLADTASQIVANIRSLGFKVEDIRLLLNSHAHHDHAGGLAALQRISGAKVMASRASAAVLRRGASLPGDPQYGVAADFPAVATVEEFGDGAVMKVGSLQLTAHLTGGHMPGGTSWSWRSCDKKKCLNLVYADSLTAVSADNFRFSDSKTYPTAVADFERSFNKLKVLPCDILLTPHPWANNLWEHMAKGVQALIDPQACRDYAVSAKQQLQQRLLRETGQRQ